MHLRTNRNGRYEMIQGASDRASIVIQHLATEIEAKSIKVWYEVCTSGPGYEMLAECHFSYSRSYPRADYPPGNSEWDTPSLHLGGIDQFKGLVPWKSYAETLTALCELHDHVEKGITFDRP